MPYKKSMPASRRRFLWAAGIALALIEAFGLYWVFSSFPESNISQVVTRVVTTSVVTAQPHQDLPTAERSQEAGNNPQAARTQPPEDLFADPMGPSLGTFPQWSTVEISLSGSESSGMSESENPFQIPVEVAFTGPGGENYLVQAFYDGDGAGGLDGSVWKARFSPDAAGEWHYTSSSSQSALDGQTGRFTVTPPTGCESYQPGGLPDFSCQGRLEYTGERYLKFSQGGYWLKGGVDEPEDFLAPGSTAGFGSREEAVDFLSESGVNSIYLLLNNIDGDGNNVWPWIGETPSEAKANTGHFDLAKLAGWEEDFTYMQNRGLVLHLVLEEDGGWTGFDRSLYYREMVARFAHHNGLIWNMSEEYNENYSPDHIQEFARMIRELDPYDHPITVHHAGSTDNWTPFLGSPQIDITSLQTKPRPQYNEAASWLSKIEASGKTIPVSFDETGQLEPSQRDLARQIVWSVYLGGANYEMFTQLHTGYTEFAGHFEDMLRARTFIEGLPFPQMRPVEGLLEGAGYVLARPGEVYAIYLLQEQAAAGATLDLSKETETLEASWYNPRTGESSSTGPFQGGASRSFRAPSSQDWVLLLKSKAFLRLSSVVHRLKY